MCRAEIDITTIENKENKENNEIKEPSRAAAQKVREKDLHAALRASEGKTDRHMEITLCFLQDAALR